MVRTVIEIGAAATAAALVPALILPLTAAPATASPAADAEPAPTALKAVTPADASVPACSERLPELWSPDFPDGDSLTGEALAEAIEGTFDARIAWGVEANGTARDRVLSVAFPEGSINPGNDDAPEGGAGFYARLPEPADRACLHYQVQFPEDMAFVKGGKLPGLFGADAPSGGDDADGRNGFSIRLMWREEGAGEVYAYVVNDGDADYGLSVGREAFAFEPGAWTDLDLEVALNDPDGADGAVRLWVDGRLVIEQTGVVFRTVDDVTVDGIMFSTFFGGSGPEWASPKDQTVSFRNFAVHGPQDG